MIRLSFERETRYTNNEDGFTTVTIGTEHLKIVSDVHTQHHVINAMTASGWTLGYCYLETPEQKPTESSKKCSKCGFVGVNTTCPKCVQPMQDSK